MSVVIDAALTHRIQSGGSLRKARDELDLPTIQRLNTDVLGLRYRTRIENRRRLY